MTYTTTTAPAKRTTLRRYGVIALTATAACFSLLQGAAQAQTPAWPTKPVSLVVPFPPGGGTDTFARPLSAAFAKVLGKQMIIDNKGGAGGTVGASFAAKAAPDGYTLFMGAVHHSIAPSMYPKLDYDIEKDFVPLVLLVSVPQVVVVNPKNIAANDMKSFLELLRKNPAKFNYGSAGSGTSHHLAGELFKLQSKTFITHIPYRGAGPALSDLVGGQVDMMFDGLGSSAGHIKGGRIKGLVVSGDKRSKAFPDIPSAKEVGLPDYTVSTWYALWAPKNTPAAVQTQIIEQVRKVMASEEVKTVWANQGAEFPNLVGKDFGNFVSAEVKRWSSVVKVSGAKLD